MLTISQLVIAIIFCVNATLSANFSIRFCMERKPKAQMNYIVLCVLISSAIWSAGMGIMSLMEDDTWAYVWRVFGIFGTFMFMMSIQKIICMLSEIPPKHQRWINGIAYLGIFVFAIYIVPGQTIFVRNALGTTFYFRQGWINTIYSLYYIIVSIDIFIVTLHMARKHPLGQIRSAGLRFLVVESFVFVGALTDMVMPSLGFAAFPGSAITHAWGVWVFWFAIHGVYKAKVTVTNMSEYIYYSLDTPVLIFNTDYKLAVANDAAGSFFKSSNPVIGMYDLEINELFDTDNRIFDFAEKSSIQRATCIANGAPCEIAISRITNKYKDIIGYILLVNDLTEHELVIQKLEQAKLAADSANMSKSLFLANMSHEIRTPMNAILGFSQLALTEKMDPHIAEYFTEIKQSGDLLLSIINDILDISKIELGKQELHKETYETAKVLRDVETITKIQALKKGLTLNTVIDPALPRELLGDKDKIREVLINLLSNAVKYTNEGHINFSVSQISKDNSEIVVEFKVADTGIGIKKEDLPTVFDKFKRLDPKLTSKTEGTGLGLSITKGLVELMGGTITVESVIGVGSVFTVTVPQQIVDFSPITLEEEVLPEKEKVTPAVPAAAKEQTKDLLFLIVDDNAINLRLTSLFLTSHGIKSEVVSSGKEAINKCQGTTYDVVLMDQMMPEMDGVEAMKHIRALPGYEKGSPQKIIALTANVIEGVEESLLAEGFDAFLGKPMDFAEFLETMNRLLPPEKWTQVTV